MLRYLREAFLFRVPVPGLGDVPVNLVALVCAAILGLGFPPVWLAALGLEVLYLFGLATHSRFQRLVDARAAAPAERDEVAWRRTVLERLPPTARRRVEALEAKQHQVLRLYHEAETSPYIIENNRAALEKLVASFVELLRTQQTLASLENSSAAGERLRTAVEALEHELAASRLSASTRDAKAATLTILQRRLEMIERREETLLEIDSSLERIEAQLDLALETAALRGNEQAVIADIDVASYLLDERQLSVWPDTTSVDNAPPRARERQ